MQYPDIITTDRLQLRPLRPDDAPRLYESVMSDPEVARFLTWRPVDSAAEATERVTRILQDQQDGTSMTWVITQPRRPQHLVGMFSCWSTEQGQELGYCLATDAWGQGLMTEAVRAVTSRLLRSPEVARVWATCDVSNTGSVRVLERAGFRREGLLRCCAVHPNVSTDPRDCLLYAAVEDDHGHTTLNPPTVFDSLQYGFSQAVEIRGGRRFLLSGQVAVDAEERARCDDLAGQTHHCLDNIERILATVGARLGHVVVLRIYLTETVGDQTAAVAAALRDRFPTRPPAATWVIVSGLADDAWLIEIEAEAVI